MLQLQNVTKIYKTKGGEVRALNGVSLNFPATGLVFINGKSGCGKTTLLNVIGGLDGIDGGEILVQDKKFSAFSATEYDAYRNTFIGFIFQEYNLLPEFTVEQNVKIAMELQGRKADEEEFQKLLKDVEIDDLKDRKPSELSGGQRQRVAIARALVKQPRIIMADEPTGALDSATGVQVLETLKKLSKDKLVIVVSHDREFAEKYADRIIHLVDGNVAEDVSYGENEITSNLKEQEESLVVKEGAELSPEEKDTLANAIKSRKKIEFIEKLTYREKRETGEVPPPKSEPVALKKSKMKLKSATALGVKSLGVKPFRLAITVLISALAFAVFGIFDTVATFSPAKILKNTLVTNPSPTVVANASYVLDSANADEYALKLSDAAVEALEDETGGKVKGIFDPRDNTLGSITHNYLITELTKTSAVTGKKYYSNTVGGFIEFDKRTEIRADGSFKDFDYELVAGEYPTLDESNDETLSESMHEVAISTYLADSILFYLVGGELNGKVVQTREDLLEAQITVNNELYRIVGLIDCGDIPEKYDVLKETAYSNVKTATLADDFSAFINAGAQKCLFVANGSLEAFNEINVSANIYFTGDADWTLTREGEAKRKQAGDYVYNANEHTKENVLLFNDTYRTDGTIPLADDEILIHALNLKTLFSEKIAATQNVDERLRAHQLIDDITTGSNEENAAALAELGSLLHIQFNENDFRMHLSRKSAETGEKIEKTVKIVGVFFGVDENTYTSSTYYKLMIGENLMREFHIYEKQGDYSKLLFSSASIRSGANALVEYFTGEDGLVLHWYNNSALSVIHANETMIKQVAELFLYAALALAAFSIFMLYNYISTSIASKKQSVGVLRGLGASGKDVLLTFLSESLVIAVINGILANVFATVGCTLVNSYVMNTINVSIAFALFGVRQVFLIAGISLLTAIASSALPIFKIAKKKPVELIR